MSKKLRAKTGEGDAENPRQALFGKFYQEGGPGFGPGNAERSAIAAGYTPKTARHNAHIFARRWRVSAKDALLAFGLDEFHTARKLAALSEAKLPKWNPAKGGTKKKPKGGWDFFDHADVQLRAVQEVNRINDAYPAPKEEGAENRPIEFIFPVNFANLMEGAKDATTQGRSSGQRD